VSTVPPAHTKEGVKRGKSLRGDKKTKDRRGDNKPPGSRTMTGTRKINAKTNFSKGGNWVHKKDATRASSLGVYVGVVIDGSDSKISSPRIEI